VEALAAVFDGQLVARGDEPAGERRHRDAAVLELGMAEPRKRRRGAQVSEAERVPHHVARLLRRALPAYQARSMGIGERQKVVRAAGDRS
jgi:hypothetical protein